ncbi:hypothetical protein LWI28_017364 [Acer negundo]|uniref:LOB domain-containing protein n=1 Tax=Acer negundo TaxID=4023 RepID=A0AAD5NX45_ACENE|nr:hypothetical protein LWI28_029228 [Acer negundo]KAI9190508.1 hypothetical protein LWI28_017364 [Acer negundo]KAK4835975.1 hypothetical protein QYF36_017025 [Acer negundo]
MRGHHEPRSSSSCAACKFLKRKCIPNCIFAPYFHSDEPKKFAKVHKVFGASNVSKILTEVPAEHREDTVNSLAYEAEARLRDPVYGCIGAIALLQRKMLELQQDLAIARARLANARFTTTTNSTISTLNNNFSSSSSSSSSSSCNLQSDIRLNSLVGFSDFPACSGEFMDNFGQNSSELSKVGVGYMFDFSQIPYI